MFELTGKVAVVTGAAGGIGTSIIEHLARAGAQVASWDLDGEGAVASATCAFKLHGIKAVGMEVDITDRPSVEAAVSEVEGQLGPIDVLVNNAGIDVIGPFLSAGESDWGRIIGVNLEGTMRCCHAVLPAMVERGQGSVVCISSDAGRVGSSGEVVYSGTKGGVISFAKALAREVAGAGVRVNSVCPGPTDTALLDQVAQASPKLYDALSRAIPLRRIARPDDISPAVVFFASDDSAYITGQTLSVSGGLTMS